MLAPLLLLVLLVTGGWYQRHAESRLSGADQGNGCNFTSYIWYGGL